MELAWAGTGVQWSRLGLGLVGLELAHAATGSLVLDGAGVGRNCREIEPVWGGVPGPEGCGLELLCVGAGVDGSRHVMEPV